jgi:hypothetical protein
MSNTFSALQPLLFGAARIVPRELTGIVAACNRDFNDKGCAKGDTVTIGISPVATVGSHTAAQTFTIGTDRIATSAVLTLNQEQKSSWNLTPEQEKSLGNGGVADDILQQTVKQHLRAHVNAIETYAWGIARKAASRAAGTGAGTDPFATDQKPLADALKILLDNGAGNMDLHAVISTTAGANLRKVSNLFKVNEGGDQMLRTGLLGNLYGMDIRESAAVTTATKGTGSGYLVDLMAGYAVGDQTIHVDTGTGTILAGDVVTFTGDSNKYVVKTGFDGDGDGDIVLQEPGLRATLANDVAMTIHNTSTHNICLRRDAVAVVARPGLQPVGGGVEQMVITDPQTGFSVLVYRAVGDGVASWYMRSVYDAFAPNPYAIADLLG